MWYAPENHEMMSIPKNFPYYWNETQRKCQTKKNKKSKWIVSLFREAILNIDEESVGQFSNFMFHSNSVRRVLLLCGYNKTDCTKLLNKSLNFPICLAISLIQHLNNIARADLKLTGVKSCDHDAAIEREYSLRSIVYDISSYAHILA